MDLTFPRVPDSQVLEVKQPVHSSKEETGGQEGRGGEGKRRRLSPPWFAVGKGELDLPNISKAKSMKANQEGLASRKQVNLRGLPDPKCKPKLRYLLPKPEATSPPLKVPPTESFPEVSQVVPPPEVPPEVSHPEAPYPEVSPEVSPELPSPFVLPKRKSLSIFLTPKASSKPDYIAKSPIDCNLIPNLVVKPKPPQSLSPNNKEEKVQQRVTRAAKKKTKVHPEETPATSPDSQELKCKNCGSMFEDKTQLETHMNDLHKVDSFACRNCKKGFICDKWTYQDHITKCLLGEASTFSCSVCQKKFISRENCAIHQREQKHQTPEEVENKSDAVSSKVQQIREEEEGQKRKRKTSSEEEEGQMKKRRKRSEVHNSAAASEEDPDDPEEVAKDGPTDEVEEERDAMELDEDAAVEYHCAYCDHKYEEQADLMEHVVNDHPDKDLKFKTRIPGGRGFSIFAWR